MSSPHLDIPDSWADAARDCLARGWRRLLVVGAADRGKSSLCAFLAASSSEAGRQVAIVDSDLGQKVIGPPAKSYKIEAVRPDAILAVAAGDELARILEPHRYIPTLRLTPSPHARAKTAAEKEGRRRADFTRYFAAAQRVRLSCSALVLQRGPMPAPSGATADGPMLLCGVADRIGAGVGLALLAASGEEAVELLTPAPAGRIAILQFGALWLTREGHEVKQPATGA